MITTGKTTIGMTGGMARLTTRSYQRCNEIQIDTYSISYIFIYIRYTRKKALE